MTLERIVVDGRTMVDVLPLLDDNEPEDTLFPPDEELQAKIEAYKKGRRPPDMILEDIHFEAIRLITDHNLTNKEVAEVLNVHNATVWAWRRRRTFEEKLQKRKESLK